MQSAILAILFVWNSNVSIVKSIQIPSISFQANGSYSDSTYMSHTNRFALDGSLDKLTLCLRISAFYLRGRNSYFFSYGSENSADTLVGFIRRTQFDKPYM